MPDRCVENCEPAPHLNHWSFALDEHLPRASITVDIEDSLGRPRSFKMASEYRSMRAAFRAGCLVRRSIDSQSSPHIFPVPHGPRLILCTISVIICIIIIGRTDLRVFVNRLEILAISLYEKIARLVPTPRRLLRRRPMLFAPHREIVGPVNSFMRGRVAATQVQKILWNVVLILCGGSRINKMRMRHSEARY